MTIKEQIDEFEAAFHRLWSNHIGEFGYEKHEWSELDGQKNALLYGTVGRLANSHTQLLVAAKDVIKNAFWELEENCRALEGLEKAIVEAEKL